MKPGLLALLTHAALPYLLTLAAILLTLPALFTGIQFDDYYHREVLQDAGNPVAAVQSLFAFLDGDPARAQRLMDSGVFPWWTLPTAHEAFWRPLAALTHWLDYRLWPNVPAAMHAHSLLWFGALVAAVAALYRRLAPTAVAASLAALLYALDDAHGFAVGWLANRNGLLAALFGVLCLHAYVRWREAAWRPGAVFAPLWLALGLLSAEAALGTLAYLAAYTVCLDHAPWRRRLLSLLPTAIVVVAWAVIYRALGYGAWGTAYLDPLREPLAFVRAALERAPILLLAQFAGPPAELYPFLSPTVRLGLWLFAILILVGLAWLYLPLLSRSPTARFWATGLLLSLLPICAPLPANRLLFFTGLGAMSLLAEWFCGVGLITAKSEAQLPSHLHAIRNMHHASSPPAPLPQSSIARRLPSVVFLFHLLSSLLLPLTSYSPALLGNIEPAALSVPAEASDTVIFLNAPSFFSVSFLGTIRAAHDLPVPARVRYLGAGPAALSLSRPAADTLVVEPAGGYLTGFDPLFRGSHHPLALGQTIALDGLTVEVLAHTPDGRPARVSFHFAVPLEDAALHWFTWRGGVFVPFTIPDVGDTVWVPPLQLFSVEPTP